MVWANYPGKGGELIVALALADWADDDGNNIYPAINTIANKARLSRRQVQYIVKKMQETDNPFLIKQASGVGRGNSVLYSINPLYIENGANFALFQKGAIHDKKGAIHDKKKVQPIAPDPLYDPLIDPSVNTSLSQKHTDADRMVAEYILSLIQNLYPEFKIPNLEKWADEIRLMRERDKRSHDQIKIVFRWANNDPFWRTNILSPMKLRKQWDQLVIKMNSKSNTTKKPDYTISSDGRLN